MAYLRSPAPDACLALVGKKLPPQDALRKAVAAVGDILEYTAPKPWQMPEWAHDQARRMGVHLELAEARLLVQRVGDGQQVLLREIEKLGTYRGRARVTAEDVLLLSPRSLEASIFDLVDAVSTRQGAKAFTAIEELYAAGERPAGLHIRLLRHFQQLTRVVALRDEGWAGAQIQQELKVKPYAAKKLLQQSQRYSVETVTQALAVLADTDARLKGMGDLPEHLELELCVGSLLGAGGVGDEGTGLIAAACAIWRRAKKSAPRGSAQRHAEVASRQEPSCPSMRDILDFLRAALFLWIALWAAALSMVEASVRATSLASSALPAVTVSFSLRKCVLMADLNRRFSRRCRCAVRTRLRCWGEFAKIHLLSSRSSLGSCGSLA